MTIETTSRELIDPAWDALAEKWQHLDLARLLGVEHDQRDYRTYSTETWELAQ